MTDQPDTQQSSHPEHSMPSTIRFESTMQVGDYAMPRAGKTSDYFTAADKKANPSVK